MSGIIILFNEKKCNRNNKQNRIKIQPQIINIHAFPLENNKYTTAIIIRNTVMYLEQKPDRIHSQVFRYYIPKLLSHSRFCDVLSYIIIMFAADRIFRSVMRLRTYGAYLRDFSVNSLLSERPISDALIGTFDMVQRLISS